MLVEVKVKPNGKEDRVIKVCVAQSLEVEIRAKPENNEANERLLSFLAKRLNLPKENLKIVKGHRERKKLIKIEGITEEAFWEKIKP
jgi:uncharacterized protein (TIGR00251 family)